MIIKGILKTIDYNNNSCTVRLPLFETTNNSGEVVLPAIFLVQPGMFNGYNEGDIVFVDFENNKLDAPIIIGKLYLGSEKETSSSQKGGLKIADLTVDSSATLPLDTKLIFDDPSTTHVPVDNRYSNYKSLLDIINAINATEDTVASVNKELLDNSEAAISEIKVTYLSQAEELTSPEINDSRWQLTIPALKDGENIWQKTTCYNNKGQILGVPEIICLTATTAAISYWLKLSTLVHKGSQQKDNILITAMTKIGTNLETEDASAILEYKWQTDETWTAINTEYTHKLLISSFKNEDLIIKASHNETEYETETITYSPLNTPVLDLSNDTATLTYEGDIKLGAENATTTAKVYLNGEDISKDFNFSWALVTDSDSTGETLFSTATITINEIFVNTTIYQCTAKVNKNTDTYKTFKDLVLTKNFTIFKNLKGESIYKLVLQNDFDAIPCNAKGDPTYSADEWKDQTTHIVTAYKGVEPISFKVTSKKEDLKEDSTFTIVQTATSVAVKNINISTELVSIYTDYITEIAQPKGTVQYDLYKGITLLDSVKFEAVKLIAAKSIEKITEHYKASNLAAGEVLLPTDEWSEIIPALSKDAKYLWNYEKIIYTNEEIERTDPVIIANWTEDGRSVKSITNYYVVNNISTLPTNWETWEWNITPQNVTSDNKYLWNYEITTYINGDKTEENTLSIPSIIGAYGEDAVDYSLILSSHQIKVKEDDTRTPTSIKVEFYKKLGQKSQEKFAGKYKIYIDGICKTSDESFNQQSLVDNYEINATTIISAMSEIKVELYDFINSKWQLVENETIDILFDGKPGPQGEPGKDGPTPVSSTTYYIYSADPPDIEDEDWKEDPTNLSIPKGGYFCWTKTVTVYSDGKSISDGPNKDAAFALAQGKTTNYYSDEDPAIIKDTNGNPISDQYGKRIKEGDCWFKTTGTNAELEGNPNTGELKQWDGTKWVDIGSEIVANKLTANYINALDITAKKITIRQDNTAEDSDILFNADGTSKEGQVKIGGFYVTKDAFVGGGVTTNNYCKLNILDTFDINGNKSSSLVIEDSSWNTINYYYTNASQNVTWESVSYDETLGTTYSQQCIYNGFVTYKCNKTKVWQNSTKGNPTISCMILKPNKTLIETKIREALWLEATAELPAITFSTTINLGIDSPSDINTTPNNQYDYIIASTPFSLADLGGLSIEEAIQDLLSIQDESDLNTGNFTGYGKIQEYARVSGPRSIGNLENLTKATYPSLTTDHYIAIFMVNIQQTYFENGGTVYDYDSAGNIIGTTEISSNRIIPTYGYCCVPTIIEIALQALEIGTNFKVRTDGTMVANNAFVTGTLNIPDTAIIGGFNISKNTLTSSTLNVTNNKVMIPSYKPLILGDNFKLISDNDGTTEWKSKISSHNPLEVLGKESVLISNNIASTDSQNASILLETISDTPTISQEIRVTTTTGSRTISGSNSNINTFAMVPTDDIFLQGGSGLGGITAPTYVTKATITATVYPNSESSTNTKAGDSYTITVYYKFGTTWSQTTLAIPKDQTTVSTTVAMFGSSSYPVYYGISKSSSSTASISSPLRYTKYYVSDTVSYSPKIIVNGTLTSVGDIYGNAFYASSDRELKTNIENIKLDSSLDKFYQQLQPVKFNFKTDLNTQHFGFIAQDLNDLLSIISTDNTIYSMVTKDDNTGHYKVNYNEIIALNTAQIKNIMNYIQELYSQYKTLELKYKKLEEKINENH